MAQRPAVTPDIFFTGNNNETFHISCHRQRKFSPSVGKFEPMLTDISRSELKEILFSARYISKGVKNMIVGETAWHKDFWGVANLTFSKSVSLNFPESSMFVKVALVRFEDTHNFGENSPWLSIGIISVKVINQFTQNFPLTRGLSGSTAATESDKNLYTFFQNKMIEVVVGGKAENCTGTLTWVLERWA